MQADTAAPLALIQGAGKRRAQGDSVFELEVPDLRIAPGELVAVAGDSGCGKSTLLDMLALVMEPTRMERFEMRFEPDDAPVDVRSLWRSGGETALAALRRDYLGYVLQTGGLLPFLDVAANIGLPSRIKGLPEPGVALDALAERLGLAGCLRRMPDALSIGQRQRVAILRALMHQPRLVLADEPTGNLDEDTGETVLQLLLELTRDAGKTLIMATHNPEIVPLADRVCRIIDGKLHIEEAVEQSPVLP